MQQIKGTIGDNILKEMLREKKAGNIFFSKYGLSENTGIPEEFVDAFLDPILDELNRDLKMQPIVEYNQHHHHKKDGILVSMLILSHERISYDHMPFVCCGKKFSGGEGKVYENCRVQYEDGKEFWYSKYQVITESCPNCSEKSRRKKVKSHSTSGGFLVWKYGQRIMAISSGNRKLRLGDEVVSNGKGLTKQGVNGYVGRIHKPYQGLYDADVLGIRFMNGQNINCEFTHLEINPSQYVDRGSCGLKQIQVIA